jgi:hypothetical protein
LGSLRVYFNQGSESHKTRSLSEDMRVRSCIPQPYGVVPRVLGTVGLPKISIFAPMALCQRAGAEAKLINVSWCGCKCTTNCKYVGVWGSKFPWGWSNFVSIAMSFRVRALSPNQLQRSHGSSSRHQQCVCFCLHFRDKQTRLNFHW